MNPQQIHLPLPVIAIPDTVYEFTENDKERYINMHTVKLTCPNNNDLTNVTLRFRANHFVTVQKCTNSYNSTLGIFNQANNVRVVAVDCSYDVSIGYNILCMLLEEDVHLKYKFAFDVSDCVANRILKVKIYIAEDYLERLSGRPLPASLHYIIKNAHVMSEYPFPGLNQNLTNYNYAIDYKNAFVDQLTNNTYEELFNMPMHTHQVDNVNWMLNIEKLISLNLTSVDIIDTNGLFTITPIRNNGERKYMYLNPYCKILYDEAVLSEVRERAASFVMRGGILADDVGLGKTFSAIGLILANPPKYNDYHKRMAQSIQDKTIKDTEDSSSKKTTKKTSTKKSSKKTKEAAEAKVEAETTTNTNAVAAETDIRDDESVTSDTSETSINADIIVADGAKSHATLIICPTRLVAQWYDEIEKFVKSDVKLRVLCITTIVQLKKYKQEDIINADIILVSFAFMTNENYLAQKRIVFSKFKWYRIIVDEGHEVIFSIDNSVPSAKLKKASTDLRDNIMEISAEHKWILSGTPFALGNNSFSGMLEFVSDRTYQDKYLGSLYEEHRRYILDTYYHGHNKAGINQEIIIPGHTEKPVFLDQTPTERAIYQNAVKDNDEKRLVQLCTHVLLSEYENNVMNGQVLSLNDICKRMTRETQTQIDYTKNLLQDTNAKTKPTLDEFDEEIKKYVKGSEDYVKCKNRRRYFEQAQKERLDNYTESLKTLQEKLKTLEKTTNRVKENLQEPCIICHEDLVDYVLPTCGHIMCVDCADAMFKRAADADGNMNDVSISCPTCRSVLKRQAMKHLTVKDSADYQEKDKDMLNKYGTKMANLIKYVFDIIAENKTNRIIVFSQYDKMLELVGNVFNEYNIEHVYVKGNVHVISNSIRKFKRDPTIRVIMLSSERCCSGSNLTEASHIILLDTICATKEQSRAIENQAIGRAARLGQKKNITVLRFIMRNTIEHDYYNANR